MFARVLRAVSIVLALLVALPGITVAQTYAQWQDHDALLGRLYDALRAKGLLAAEAFAADIEAALEAGPALFTTKAWDDGRVYVLTDGQTESMTALLATAADGKGTDVVSLGNPYHLLSLYLGAYYNEVGRYEDAVRVLDAGLALSFDPDQLLGETVPDILSERGVAYTGLKQWPDALASYERGLGIPTLADYARALLLRGRGFALIELGRLGDAEASYNESLKIEPDNRIALGELAYIANLRSGGKPQEPNITLPNKN